MEEKVIYQVSLVMILVGLIILLICADQIDVNGITTLEEVSASTPVKLTGTLTKVSNIGTAVILEVEGQRTEKTAAIVFEDENLFLEVGDEVEISGTTEEYNGQQEIIATKVTKR